MNRCELLGWGTYLPENEVRFGPATRYRVTDGVQQLDMLAHAAQQALERAGIEAGQIDCIIAAVAAGIQPIPCTAALVMERIAPHAAAAALDVNTTCTSFITAVDIASRFLHSGQYGRVLIVSGDVGSRFLNPGQPESFTLFSDAAAAVVLSATDDDRGVIASAQRTWPQHAHDTEVRGGLSRRPPQDFPGADPADYLFDMNGRRALTNMLSVLPGFFEEFFSRVGMRPEEFGLVVPHQASPALALAMARIGFPPGSYVDNVARYGNMVSASVPFTWAEELDAGRSRPGTTVLLCGTAAGLTANALAFRI